MEHHANVFLTNLAMVLCVAAVTTVVFQRFKQPVVLGYILAGLLVGAHVPFPLVADIDTIHGLSELGVILLLFTIGLEFTIQRLLRVGASAGIIAVVEISVMILLGDAAGRMFGWSARGRACTRGRWWPSPAPPSSRRRSASCGLAGGSVSWCLRC